MSFTINVLDHVDGEIKFESFLEFSDHNYTSVDVIQPGYLKTNYLLLLLQLSSRKYLHELIIHYNIFDFKARTIGNPYSC